MRRFIYLLVCLFIFSIQVKGQLVANFSATPTTGCNPILVQFTDNATGGATSWQWNLGNGTTSTLQNPSTTYTSPGTYSVTLTVSNGSQSATKTITNYITVIAPPIAAFTASDTTLSCFPKTVGFTATGNSATTGLSYLWDFGDGNTSTAANPTHTYLTGGNFSVTLSVINGSGCVTSLTKTGYIQTATKPSAGFSYSGNAGCMLPATVAFSNTTTGPANTTYLWDFGNGATSTAASPSYTYTSAGTYTVRLIASSNVGCKDTFIQTVNVSVSPITAGFSASSARCAGQAITFTNTSSPAPTSVLWDFGDGTTSTAISPQKAYASAGTYTVTLTAYNGVCSSTVTQQVQVSAVPVAGFTFVKGTFCNLPVAVSFTNTSTGGGTYLWDFGDGTTSTATSPSHNYTANGSYPVTLTVTNANGCVSTYSSTVDIQPFTVVISRATVDGLCVTDPVVTVAYTNPVVPGTTYSWNFGDGTTGSGKSPSHTYSAPGAYTVTVTATTPGGCTASTTFTVNVNPKPVASFTASPLTVCTNTGVIFSNTSTGATRYSWNFGDGGTSTNANPTHTYSAAGVYTVTLTATNGNCSDVFTRTNYITVIGPLAQFTDSVNCSNKLNHYFRNASTGALTYLWNFGDGTTSTAASPSHTYASAGTYSVQLTAYNGICSNSITQTIRIYNTNPSFSAAPTTVCKGVPVGFSMQNAAGIATVAWNFGDGTITSPTGNATTLSHSYSQTGTYTVRAFITDSIGCTDSFSRLNYISVKGLNPGFYATPLQACVPLSVNFFDTSTNPGLTVTSRFWDFGDGTTLAGNNPTPTHLYSNAGVYSIKLVQTDISGCKDSLIKPQYITAGVIAAGFYSSDTFRCIGQPVSFVNTSAFGSTYLWDFGDGTTSTAASPVKTYTQSGTFTVRLIVTGLGGCKDTLIRTGYIRVPALLASFTMSDSVASCPPLSVQFTTPALPANTTFQWLFGNGSTSTLSNPTTVYTRPGVYTVRLIVSTSGGCTDTALRTVYINGPTGTVTYTPSPATGCAPLQVTLTVNSQNATSYTYDFQNGFTATTTSSTYTYTYTNAGTFVPTIILRNASGCNTVLPSTDTVRVQKVTAGFTVSPASACTGAPFTFTNTSTASGGAVLTSYQWSFGDGTTSTATSPVKTYSTGGIYQVRLIATSNVCSDTVIQTVTVLPKPNQIVTGGSVCAGQSTTLTASGATSYVWSPSAGLSCTNCRNPTANPTITTTYTVIGTDANGCHDTDQVLVNVSPLPLVDAGNNATICSGTSATLTATGATTYVWSPATGLSATTGATVTASPTATTLYTVTGTTNGCSTSDTVRVFVNPNAVITTNGAQTICLGNSVTLTATGATGLTWTPAAGLSTTTGGSVVASPTTTTTYTVSGTSNGCSGSATVTVTVNPTPNVTVNPNAANICNGSSITLMASGAATYSWSPATGLNTTTGGTVTASPTATRTYLVTGTSSVGCVDTQSVTIVVNPLPVTAATTARATICEGDTTVLTTTGAATYSWTPAAGLSCTNCANPVASPTATTTYTVTGSTAAGCSTTAQVTVNVSAAPVVTVSPNATICIGENTSLLVNGGNSYVWSPSATLSCAACTNPTANPLVTTTYTVVATGANGCTTRKNVTVSVNPLPAISAGPDTMICANTPTRLHATGGVSYIWSPASGLSCTNCANPVAIISSPATYVITGRDAKGCVNTDTISLSVMQRVPVSVSPNDSICEGESAQLKATGGISYLWSPGTGLSSTQSATTTASPMQTTQYTVIIRENACYTDTLQTTVFVSPLPQVNAGPDQVIGAGNSVVLQGTVSSNAVNLRWTPDSTLSCANCLQPTATPKGLTTYTLTATTTAGCQASDAVVIQTECLNGQVFVPNTFTPNGDGKNDVFYPRGKGISTVKLFRIFDRWGELVFEVRDFDINDSRFAWDGLFKNNPLKPDTYVWIMEAVCEAGDKMTFKGDVSIIR